MGAAGSGLGRCSWPGQVRVGSHQQLLRDQLHDQLLWPLVSLPAGGEGQEGASPLPPTLAPCPHSQVLALVHVGLAGKGPLQLRGGVRVGSALLWWGQRGLWTQPSCTGWLPTCGTPKSAPTLQTPRAQAAGAHLLPLQDTAPGQQLVAEPVLTNGQAPEGESRRGGPDGAQGPKDPSTLLRERGRRLRSCPHPPQKGHPNLQTPGPLRQIAPGSLQTLFQS